MGTSGKAIGLDIEPGMVAYMKADAKKLKLSNYEARLAKPDDPRGWRAERRRLHRRLEQCPRCRYQASITAGTVFHRTRIPLRLWFLGIFFLASDKQEILALQFERDMGLGSHQTAWTLRHKLRSALWHRPEHRLRAGWRPTRSTWARKGEGAPVAEGNTMQIPTYRVSIRGP